jgi:GntR family transcriptional regulator/MocR family aminotransferase
MADLSAALIPFITVDRGGAAPLHRQIYDGFRAAILRGDLRQTQKVPSSRSLAIELRISRFPVLDAYGQLLAEGYFESRKGAGTFVARALPGQLTSVGVDTGKLPPLDASSRPFSHRCSLLPRYQVTPWRHGWGAFGVHQPALDQFPFEVWSRLAAKYSRSPRLHAIHNIDPLGSEPFREAICSYLRSARGIQCEAYQVMVVSGSQQSLEITARVLLDPRDRVWVEDPTYPLTRAVLLGAGCRLVPVPVDEQGMNIAAGMKLCRKARAAFVTPSHHYPLGCTMSASRRVQLLNWAQSTGSWIVEDDYDSEYRYESMPIASLQGMDANRRVIYIGTFSKVLFPSLRVGYIVIPPDLVNQFMTVRFAMDIFPPYLNQEILTEFMRSGQFVRHIQKMRQLYKGRRTALVESLREVFGDRAEVHGAEAGMHVSVTFPATDFSDTEVATKAAREGLWLWPLSPCYLSARPHQGFILGFGCTPAEQIPKAVERLHAVFPRQ